MMTSIHKYHIISKYSIHHINIYLRNHVWLFKVINPDLNFQRSNSNKSLIKIWSYPIKNIKKITRKDQISPNDFFLKKQLKKFSCTSWSLLFCKINKKDPESRFKVKKITYHFCSKMTKLLWVRFLSEKPINFHVSPFHCAKS